ncbi:hypothetical protein POREN0001_0826 [Porphyromonas endodontalis ATCC 35406]|uniref:Uncharacterized protein n=1 Tax=Porphyromonas endodontalis (strain ATCC 35406 / DSM 24491 / JCM 8526 / CCUG 16442 / BCRC 14492 / NCTC 13058 / HG 370) TaxID=553175 RepID=C3J9S5_POREA|nr:hypothetical protein POREN0001_0826 [Porphyromonas endodontalis ATCC 35406]
MKRFFAFLVILHTNALYVKSFCNFGWDKKPLLSSILLI